MLSSKNRLLIFIVALFTLALATSQAAEPKTANNAKATKFAAPTETAEAKPKSLTVTYASAPWNKSSESIDTAFLFLRDKNSSKIAKILLEESAPDSSVFSGQFSVNWSVDKPLEPEVYIPPQNMRNDARAVERFNALLQSKKITPQPLLVRHDGGQQVLEVFDTQELAKRARSLYQKELEATKQAEQSKLVKPQADEKSLQVAKMAAQTAALAQLAKEAAQREGERLRLEQIEQQRIEKLRQQQTQLAAAEKARRQRLADQAAQRAIAHYQQAEFAQAVEYFSQAVELDPQNRSHYFMYGVSLYRIDKFDDALVILKGANDSKTALERDYYMGLIHFRLKELEPARNIFAAVKRADDPVLSPSSAFYEGLILFSEEKLEAAQTSFEFVLDKSNDPALDKKAEEYIEKIAQLIQYRKMAEKKIFVNVRAGLNYDSNILLSPDNDSTTASALDEGGARLMFDADGEYRFFYLPDSDLSIKGAVSNIYSFNDDFVQADPLITTITTPYSRKGIWKNKGYKLTLTPGYESLQMDFDASEKLTNILTTLLVNADLMLVMRDDWFSSVALDIRNDDSSIPGTDATDNDADALKITLKKTETLFLDSSKKRAIIGSLGFVLNDADGIEKSYNRIELLALYTAPFVKFKNMSWNTGLSFYNQDYGDSSTGRKDTNVTFLFGVNKIINEKWSWTGSATYTSNVSNESTSDYSKYVVMGAVSYAWSR